MKRLFLILGIGNFISGVICLSFYFFHVSGATWANLVAGTLCLLAAVVSIVARHYEED